MKQLVGLCGLNGAGKSTAAGELIVRHRFVHHPLAGPLKDMLEALGLSDHQLNGSLKEVPCDLLMGKTPRHAMKTLGIEWGRDWIGDDFWLNAWREGLPVGQPVVVDDVRFENEAQAIRDLGGVVIEIKRPGLEPSDHRSECPPAAEYVVTNNGSVEGLCGAVIELVTWANAAE